MIPGSGSDKRADLSNRSLFEFFKENTDPEEIKKLLKPFLNEPKYEILRDAIKTHQSKRETLKDKQQKLLGISNELSANEVKEEY